MSGAFRPSYAIAHASLMSSTRQIDINMVQNLTVFKLIRVLLSGVAACLPGVLPAQTIAPAKVAIISAQKAVADTQEIRKAQVTLEAKYRPRQQAIEALQRDLQTIQQQLSAPNMTPDREAQLRQTATVKQKQLQRLGEDLQSDVNGERQDILGRAGRQMSDVIRKIAEAHGLDVIVDVQNTLYYKPTLDLTAEATAAYDKAYPAK
ncbi:MAG: OmpH family outer membrane protein [Acidobacteriaceae bacterium]|nr:OmpH family outer membrane protein [Acidobacteriaceae bacterium]